MNAAIRAVVRMGLFKGLKVMGIERGYSGLINGDLKEMDTHSVSDTINRGGTFLKTARCDEFKTEEGRIKAANVLKVYGVEGLIVIGGDGSFTGARLLSKLGVSTIGIPGTIDNDLEYTDCTLGFDTALNTVLEAINRLRDTSTSHERVSVVEVMGRNCGDIALYSGLAGGAESIIMPEKGIDTDKICKTILMGKTNGKKHNLIILAEGIMNAGTLARQIEDVTGIETRATTLGHTQRGGSPSAFDSILAAKMGSRAVELLMEGKTSRVIGVKGSDLIDMDIDEALSMPRTIDENLYDIAMALSN
jgi:6-phosphofructokinase 1